MENALRNLEANLEKREDDPFLLIVEEQIHKNVEQKVHAYDLHSCFFLSNLN